MDADMDDINILEEPPEGPILTHVFSFGGQLTYAEKNTASEIIQNLGGAAKKIGSDKYTRDITHVLCGESISPRLNIIGALAAGKPIVSYSYILACLSAGHFINEDDFLHPSYKDSIQSTQLNGKIFDNQNVAVMIWDQAKKRQIEEILKAGGAKLKYFIAKDLCNLSVAESEALEFIFTDPIYSEDLHFSQFIAKSKRNRWKVKILSYLAVYKYPGTFPGTQEQERIAEIFSIDNEQTMKLLHKPKRGMAPPSRSANAPKRFRKEEVVVDLTRDDDEVTEMDLAVAGHDDDVEIIDFTRNTVSRVKKENPRQFAEVFPDFPKRMKESRRRRSRSSSAHPEEITISESDSVEEIKMNSSDESDSSSSGSSSGSGSSSSSSSSSSDSSSSGSESEEEVFIVEDDDDDVVEIVALSRTETSTPEIPKPFREIRVSTNLFASNESELQFKLTPSVQQPSVAGLNSTRQVEPVSAVTEDAAVRSHVADSSQFIFDPTLNTSGQSQASQVQQNIRPRGLIRLSRHLFEAPKEVEPPQSHTVPTPVISPQLSQGSQPSLAPMSDAHASSGQAGAVDENTSPTHSENLTAQPDVKMSGDGDDDVLLPRSQPLQPSEIEEKTTNEQSANLTAQSQPDVEMSVDETDDVLPRSQPLQPPEIGEKTTNESLSDTTRPKVTISPFGKDRHIRKSVKIVEQDQSIRKAAQVVEQARPVLPWEDLDLIPIQHNTGTDLTQEPSEVSKLPFTSSDATQVSSRSQQSTSEKLPQSSTSSVQLSSGSEVTSSAPQPLLSVLERIVEPAIESEPVKRPPKRSTHKKDKPPKQKERESSKTGEKSKEKRKEKVSRSDPVKVSLDLGVADKYLSCLVSRQQSTNECIELSGVSSHTQRFDSRNEANIEEKYFVKPMFLASIELDTNSDFMETYFGVECQTLIEREYISLQLIEEVMLAINSVMRPTSKLVNQIITDLFLNYTFSQTDEKAEIRKLGMITSLEAFLYTLIRRHLPINDNLRLYYLRIFQLEFRQIKRFSDVGMSLKDFFEELLSETSKPNPRPERIALLKAVVHLLQRDLEYWWKHCRPKNKEVPLVGFVVHKGSLESILKKVVGLYLHVIEEDDFEMTKCLREVIGLLAMYVSHLDYSKDLGGLSLNSSRSNKLMIAHLFLNHFALKIKSEPKVIWRHLYLLRPSWLPGLVAALFIEKLAKFPTSLKEISLQSFCKERIFGCRFEFIRDTTTRIEGDSKIHIACRLGDLDELERAMLECKLDICSTNKEKRTPIHEAAKFDQSKCLSRIRDLEPNNFCRALMCKDSEGEYPTSVAIRYNSVESANYLLQNLKLIDTNLTQVVGPSGSAKVSCKSLEMVQVLEQHGVTTAEAPSGSEIIVHKKKLFEMMMSLTMDKLMSTIPSNIVCISSLLHENPKFSSLRFTKLSRAAKKGKLKHFKDDTVSFDNGIVVSKKNFLKDVSLCNEFVNGKQKEECSLSDLMAWKFKIRK